MWKKIVFIFVMCIGAGWLTAKLIAQPVALHPLFKQHAEFMSIAHQGGYLLWPSNTLHAFEQADTLGVSMLELDVHLSADNKIVVIHDDTVDRTTNGTGKVAEMAYQQLVELDAGYRWLEDAPGDFPFRNKKIRIPLLSEVFQQFSHQLFTIELKANNNALADALCLMIRDYNKQQDVVVGSFHQDVLDHFRQQCPQVATSMAKQETTWFVLASKLGLASLTSPAGEVLQVPVSSGGLTIVTPAFIADAHERGLKVQVWTVNDPWEMRQLIDMGVDGIITDRPDYLINLLKNKNSEKKF